MSKLEKLEGNTRISNQKSNSISKSVTRSRVNPKLAAETKGVKIKELFYEGDTSYNSTQYDNKFGVYFFYIILS